MEISSLSMFWLIVAVVFGPVEVVAYIASIIKTVIDRRKTKERIAAVRKAKLDGTYRPQQKRRNIQVIEDTARKMKYNNRHKNNVNDVGRKGAPSSGNATNSDHSSNPDSDAASAKKKTEYNVQVSVEHNPSVNKGSSHLETHSNNTNHGRLNHDNEHLGSSTDSARGGLIEMDNLSSGLIDDLEATATSKVSTGHSNSGANTVFSSEIDTPMSPNETIKDPNKTLAEPHRQHKFHKEQSNQKKTHRPPKPKRSGNGSNKESGSIGESSVKHMDSSEDNVVCPNGVPVLVNYHTHGHVMNGSSLHQSSNRRNSYTTVANTDYTITDASPTRSRSEDNLHNKMRVTGIAGNPSTPNEDELLHLKDGNVNKGFIASENDLT